MKTYNASLWSPQVGYVGRVTVEAKDLETAIERAACQLFANPELKDIPKQEGEGWKVYINEVKDK